MYPTFDHWAYVDHLLPMLTMCSPCAHWVFGPSPPVSVCFKFAQHIPVGYLGELIIHLLAVCLQFT
jgi:hypothetical protein